MNTPLIVGKPYHIHYEDPKNPDSNFIGVGVLRRINPPNYDAIIDAVEWLNGDDPTPLSVRYSEYESNARK